MFEITDAAISENKAEANMSLGIDDFEVESFVTGFSEDEQKAIDGGLGSSCSPPSASTPPPNNCVG